MANKRDSKEYIYLSTVLRAKGAKMLSRDKAERMLDAPSFEEAAKMLTENGYPDMSAYSAKQVEAAVAQHGAKLFQYVAQLCPSEEVIDLFRIKYDYHNLKTIMKAEAAGIERNDLLSEAGRVPVKQMLSMYQEEKYLGLPETMAKALVEAKTVLAHSANPQQSDFILDKAYFEEIQKLASNIGSKFMKGYSELLIDSANLRSAVRSLRMKKDADFLKNALVPGGGVDVKRILDAASSGEALAALFAKGALAKAAPLGAAAAAGEPMTNFELACDNAITDYLAGSSMIAFGEEPVVAYLSAVETEIATVRMILTGKLSGISSDTIRERLRDIHA